MFTEALIHFKIHMICQQLLVRYPIQYSAKQIQVFTLMGHSVLLSRHDKRILPKVSVQWLALALCTGAWVTNLHPDTGHPDVPNRLSRCI
jgi:hypothetical protein